MLYLFVFTQFRTQNRYALLLELLYRRQTMTLPDRMSVDERSPFYNAEALERGVGILFNGKERQDVNEYCVSEGWIRVATPKSKDRFGQPLTIKLKGEVKPFVKE